MQSTNTEIWKFSLASCERDFRASQNGNFSSLFRRKSEKPSGEFLGCEPNCETMPTAMNYHRDEVRTTTRPEVSLHLELKSNEKYSGILNENVTSSAEERLSSLPVSMVRKRRTREEVLAL